MGTPKGTKPWNAGKSKGWIDPRGYRIVSVTINGKRHQIREHRLIMETHLGRTLEPWEVVHHKDGNPLNNALGNLEVMDATMIRHWINLHRGDCEAVARFMAYTLRIGGIGTCRQFVEYATAP